MIQHSEHRIVYLFGVNRNFNVFSQNTGQALQRRAAFLSQTKHRDWPAAGGPQGHNFSVESGAELGKDLLERETDATIDH